MDVSALISSFVTGTYAVTRTARGTVSRGKVQQGSQTTISISAAVSPASGADIKRLPEGRRTNAAKTIFTTTQLLLGGQGDENESDIVSIDGSTWEVSHVELWTDPATGATGYRCVAVETV